MRMCLHPLFSRADAQLRYFTLCFTEYPNVRYLAKTAPLRSLRHSHSVPQIRKGVESVKIRAASWGFKINKKALLLIILSTVKCTRRGQRFYLMTKVIFIWLMMGRLKIKIIIY